MPARFGVWWKTRSEKWGVSGFGVFAILLAFALAGMSCLRLSHPLMDAIVPHDAPSWLWWTIRIVVILPLYEALLLAYGTLLGQRRFFWAKQKGLLRLIARPFSGRP